MRKRCFALYSPIHGWWAGMDGTPGGYLFTKSAVDACILDSEDSAFIQGVSMGDQLNGDAFWVYEIIPRRYRPWRAR